MKFVCERCHTRYSIADDKVRQKILKIRCKTCENVITVRDPGAGAEPPPPPPTSPPPTPGRAVPGGAAAAREWFVAVNGEQVGPLTRSDAARRALQTREEDEVYVWKDGLDGWKPPAEIPAIQQEMNSLRGRPSVRLPIPPRTPGKPPAGRPSAGVAGKGPPGKPAPMAASAAGRGSAPATARLAAASDAYPDEEHTQIQPFDAGLLAPDGFGKPAHATGAVLPFTGGARPANGEAGAPRAPLEGLFSDLTPIPQGGAVAAQVAGAQALSSLSRIAARPSPVVKFVAAGAVVAALIVLMVVVLVSRPSEPPKTAQPATPAAVKSPPPSPDPIEPKPRVAVIEPPAPMPAPTRRAAKGPASRPRPQAIAPPSLEPAPLASDPSPSTGGPHRATGAGPERRVPEFKGTNRPGGGASASGDGPTEGMIIAVVKKNQATIKTCYERALKRDDRLRSGRIDVSAELGASGIVKSVSLSAPPEFATVEACIKTAVRRWAFPSAPHEYRADFPLIMQGNL